MEEFGGLEHLQDIYIISKEFCIAKAILQLAYYEIIEGPDLKTMLSGFYRAGHTV